MKYTKPAFTILEMMIVLLIMGLVYSLSITTFSKKTIEEQDTYFDLKKILIAHIAKEYKIIQLVVFDDDEYVLLRDTKELKKTSLKLPKKIEFFAYEQDGLLKEYYKPYYKDKYFRDVKFRFLIYQNGSSTKAIVAKEGLYYIQSNYFKDRKIFDTLYNAKEYLLLEILGQSMVEVSG